jgi:S-adenosyl-L-methionine hydrolase (adenosine-forming)
MLITLTTDFGYQDAFVGVMKAVIAGINPNAQVVDLTHGIPAQDVMAAALTLRHAIGYFPRGTIHVAVVDPGVGSARKPALIGANGNYFVGPDNGIFSLALEGETPGPIVHLSNPAYHLQPTSKTFHGRDIFAPAAAHLSLGVPPANFGKSVNSFVQLTLPKVVRHEREIDGEIIYIDVFGNLFTNIREHDLTGLPSDGLKIALGPVWVCSLAASYAGASKGELVALVNSWGLLEIAENSGNAARRTGAQVGDKVKLSLRE